MKQYKKREIKVAAVALSYAAMFTAALGLWIAAFIGGIALTAYHHWVTGILLLWISIAVPVAAWIYPSVWDAYNEHHNGDKNR